MSAGRDTDHTDGADHVGQLTIRLLAGSDLAAIRRLAERDSSAVPELPLLGAELDGELIAATSLGENPQTLADPFRRSADARALLEERAAQLRGAPRGRRRRLGRLREALPHARAGLAGSPPGAGGRLLRL